MFRETSHGRTESIEPHIIGIFIKIHLLPAKPAEFLLEGIKITTKYRPVLEIRALHLETRYST